MVKKLIIEKDDESKMLKWDEERLKLFRERYNSMNIDGVEYIITLDIADEDSQDVSMLCNFKLTDGKYEFVGADEI
jgi:hypothetical protein